MRKFYKKKSKDRPRRDNDKSSWQGVSSWYSKSTEGKGHYYHEHVVIPGVLRLLNLKNDSKLLDLGSGSGVLGRATPKDVRYLGVDLSDSLTRDAGRQDRNITHKYLTADVTKRLSIDTDFTHATLILSLQNMQDGDRAIENASKHLVKNGTLVIVLNHPVLRIPRQTSWEINPQTKIQYRRIDRYLNPMEIPVSMNPGQKNSPTTWSYHHSISDYSKMLNKSGFVIELIEEWTSDKESVGKASKMENRARSEFPLFMAIRAKKIQL